VSKPTWRVNVRLDEDIRPVIEHLAEFDSRSVNSTINRVLRQALIDQGLIRQIRTPAQRAHSRAIGKATVTQNAAAYNAAAPVRRKQRIADAVAGVVAEKAAATR